MPTGIYQKQTTICWVGLGKYILRKPLRPPMMDNYRITGDEMRLSIFSWVAEKSVDLWGHP